MCVCVYIHRERERESERDKEGVRQLIKNCIYRIMEACKSKIYRMSLEVSDPGEPVFQLESKALFCGTRKS